MEVTVQEVAELLRGGGARVIDVREPWEIETASISGTEPLTQELVNELIESGDREASYIFVCHHGIRSLNAAGFFASHGFKNVKSMRGGIHAWSAEVDPEVPVY